MLDFCESYVAQCVCPIFLRHSVCMYACMYNHSTSTSTYNRQYSNRDIPALAAHDRQQCRRSVACVDSLPYVHAGSSLCHSKPSSLKSSTAAASTSALNSLYRVCQKTRQFFTVSNFSQDSVQRSNCGTFCAQDKA